MVKFIYSFGGSSTEIKTSDPAWKVVETPKSENYSNHDFDERTRKVAGFVAEFWVSHRYGPTFREIQAATGLGSLATVKEIIDELAHLDLVTYVPKQARTLVPTDKLLK